MHEEGVPSNKKKTLEIGKRKGCYPIRKASHRERLTIP
jgi:hypothetical protein